MKIHHIGYLVKDLQKACLRFQELGFKSEGRIINDSLRDINILFMTNGTYRIELVSPQSEKSIVFNTLKKMGATAYHLCFFCNNIYESIDSLKKDGFILTTEIQPAVAFDGQKVCFLYNKAIGLIELIEQAQSEA